jgi:hypothetical protein
VAVIDFSYGSDGAVTAAAVRGELPPELTHCLEAAAKHAKRKHTDEGPDSAGLTSERCSIVFGSVEAGDSPGLELSATTATLVGAQLGKTAELADARSETSKHLTDALRASAKRGEQPVIVRGPLIVRADAATPGAVIRRVITTLLVEHRDFVLAARDGAHWRLLEPVELPVVPVPAGIVGNWGVTTRVDDHGPVLSMLVRAQDVWVGTSAGTEHDAVPVAQLVGKLAAESATPVFKGRAQIELAFDDDATYGELAQAIAAASTAGFTAWQLVPKGKLHAHP